MGRRQVGLTARLALVGIASALVPFVVGGLVLLLVPQRVVGRQVDAELDSALAVASARIQERRADLAFALARVDDRELAGLVRADDAHGIKALVRSAAGGALDDPEAGRLEVRIAGPDEATSTAEADLTSSVRLRGARRDVHVVLADVDAAQRLLARVAEDADVRIALVAGPGRGTAVGDGSWQANGSVGNEVRFSGADMPSHWRSIVVDDASDLVLVAGVDGSPVRLLLRGRGGDIQLALLLLLGAGMLCAVSMALIMNRLLGRVADNAERMSAGDFDTRLAVVGTDAGARVATSLNELAAELQARIATLELTVDQLDRTLAAIDDGVCTWSPAGELETWNAGAAALAGATEDQMRAGAPTVALLRSHLQPGTRRVLLPVGDGDGHLVVELEVRSMPDGGLLQVFRDASRALSIEQARANFLVTAAHELRTPLTSIVGFSATLADETLDLPAHVRAGAIGQVFEQSLRLDAIVTSLFESSLIVRGKVEVTLEQVDVGELVQKVVAESGIDRVEVVGGVEGVAARTDPGVLSRALGALVENAGKYGAPPIEVRLDAAARTDLVRIAVRDRGGGIPIELHEAIFEPFYRLDPEMRSDVGGAGMGLYNARRLMEALGGSIVVGADPGSGMEFVVELPASGQLANAPMSGSASRSAGT